MWDISLLRSLTCRLGNHPIDTWENEREKHSGCVINVNKTDRTNI